MRAVILVLAAIPLGLSVFCWIVAILALFQTDSEASLRRLIPLLWSGLFAPIGLALLAVFWLTGRKPTARLRGRSGRRIPSKC